jgi:glycosyltransferase involved in cell wall biosynthesis
VHAHLVAAGIAGTLGARLARVPRVVVTFHNLTDWQEKRSHPLRVAGRRALRWCDAVVAVSEAVRGAMARVDLALARRAHVIPNGIDLSLFAGLGRRRDEARALRGLGPDEIVVGTVARLERRKGVDLLIEAMPLVAARLPRLKLRVIGDGPERSSLEGRVRQLGLGERVELVGERGDVHEELAALDLFAAPSRSEGQGVAVIEALAAGLPVIGARVGGIPEVLGHGACGVLVEPESPGALADAIVGLALSDERRRFSESGRARARSFSLDETRARLERLYESLLARSEERAAA